MDASAYRSYNAALHCFEHITNIIANLKLNKLTLSNSVVLENTCYAPRNFHFTPKHHGLVFMYYICIPCPSAHSTLSYSNPATSLSAAGEYE